MNNAEELLKQAKLLIEHEKRIETIRKNHPEWTLMALQLGVTVEKFLDVALRTGYIDDDGNLTQDFLNNEVSARDAHEMIKLKLMYRN